MGHTAGIKSAVFGSDTKRVVTASGDNNARIWDVESGKELQVLSGHTSRVYSAVFSSDNKRVVTAADKTIIWV